MTKKMIAKMVFFILLLTVATVSIGGDSVSPERALRNFQRTIEIQGFDDVSLTIYYFNPYALTPMPVSVEMLIDRYCEYRIDVDGLCLEEHRDILEQLYEVTLLPKDSQSYVDVRIFYVFKYRDRALLDVAMWGGHDSNNSLYFNGVEVEGHEAFYNIITPFLPEYEAEIFELYVSQIQRGIPPIFGLE